MRTAHYFPPAGFGAGFKAMLPLWMGVVPFGIAYAVSARAAGLSLFDTQLMSLAVFAGSSQFTAAGMFAAGASPLALVLTTFVINVRHLLYSLTLGQRIRLPWPQRVPAAMFLTDEAFGVVAAARSNSTAFLFGAELSLYAAWNLATLAGAVVGGLVPDPAALGIDIVFPLAFIALLVPLLERPVDVAVATFAGVAGLVASNLMPGGLAVLVVGVLGALLGAWLTRGEGVAAEGEVNTGPANPRGGLAAGERETGPHGTHGGVVAAEHATAKTSAHREDAELRGDQPGSPSQQTGERP